MKFEENPYYSPEKCGLEIFEDIDTAGSYEYDMIVIWKRLSDNTLWWDSDSGCSCPSPFDNGDHGHDLKELNKDTFYNFNLALENHCNISKEQIENISRKVKDFLGLR